MKKYLWSLLAGSIILLGSCTKEGERGPAGSQGEPGEEGPQGPAGPQGEPGSANVIYSDWRTINLAATSEPDIFVQQINAPQLTTEVADQGVILMYGERGGMIFPLPLSTLWFNYRAGEILLLASDLTFEGDKFRYVLIPGGVAAGGRTDGTTDWRSLSYEEVIRRLNIPAKGAGMR
ncbi:MAG TPA: hypothetical protein VHK69_12420 [Chitinophagaceae bacterium]|jgi:hypothetical protein|nr:hypothetical protein [Chitinophagaceae bacterium]